MRVLVCGGRDYADESAVCAILNCLNDWWGIDCIIEGGALGADRFARRWGAWVDGLVTTYEADWSAGRRAGPIRNQRMLDEGRPDVVVAFPGGTGTRDMVRKARAAGVPVMEVPRAPLRPRVSWGFEPTADSSAT